MRTPGEPEVGLSRRVLVVAALLIIVATPVVTAGLATSGTPTECGGQCKAPYELDVVFQSGTSKVVAQRVMTECSRLPTVIRLGGVRRLDTDQLQGRIYTTKMGRGSDTRPLLTCLDNQQTTVGAAWPD
jgi:hypothetical protein